jgi:predicted ATPase/DNA-binding CsgD family transcriptional regulator
MSIRMMAPRSSAWPGQRTPLIGRERDIAEASGLLLEDAAPLLTLVGPGGVGKTRLALAVAQEVAPAFDAGAVFVDLAPVTDPGLVPATVAAALRVATTRRHVTEAVIAHLRSRQILVLLDNCEHVMQSAATLTAALLAACPALQILATSRAPLRVRGEHLYPVSPLAVSDANVTRLDEVRHAPAVALFTHRARAARPTFALDEGNAAAVAAICRELDGLPLAIELAAARSGMLSPPAMLALMSHRLCLLTRGPRDVSPRHQALRDTIAWSHDLLDEPARIVMRRLAVFVGGFTLEAAEWVAGEQRGDEGGRFAPGGRKEGVGAREYASSFPPLVPHSPPSVLDVLFSLTDQSLLVRQEGANGEARFRMLETIGEFARERLDESGEGDNVRTAHAEFFLDIAEAAEPLLRARDQSTWLNRLEAEHANFRVALRWFLEWGDRNRALRLAGALGLFWRWRCHFGEGRQWLERLLADAGGDETISAATRARAATAAGALAWAQGDLAPAGAHLEASRKLFLETGDERGLAFCLYNLGTQVKLQGDLTRAAALYQASHNQYEALGDDWGAATLRHAIANLALDSGDLTRAHELLTENVELARGVGDRWLLGATLCNLGMAVARQGHPERANPLLEEALTLFRAIGERRWIAHTCSFQGLLASWRGDQGEALAAYREALGIAVELDVRFYIAEIFERIAALIARGDAERAARLLGAAGALREVIASPPLPVDRLTRDDALTATRAALGDAAYEAARDAGRALPLSEAIAEALALEIVVAPEPGTRAVVRSLPPPAQALQLTAREHEILELLCQRMTDQEISERLFISRRTVSHHVGNILTKLDVTNRRQAAALAARQQLV